jgi:hypothetical protein
MRGWTYKDDRELKSELPAGNLKEGSMDKLKLQDETWAKLSSLEGAGCVHAIQLCYFETKRTNLK